MEWLGVWNCNFSGSEFSNFGAWNLAKIALSAEFQGLCFRPLKNIFSDSGKWPFHTPPIHTPTKRRPRSIGETPNIKKPHIPTSKAAQENARCYFLWFFRLWNYKHPVPTLSMDRLKSWEGGGTSLIFWRGHPLKLRTLRVPTPYARALKALKAHLLSLKGHSWGLRGNFLKEARSVPDKLNSLKPQFCKNRVFIKYVIGVPPGVLWKKATRAMRAMRGKAPQTVPFQLYFGCAESFLKSKECQASTSKKRELWEQNKL